jgi:hypothetical protein
LITRDVEVRAECPPDSAGLDAVLDGLRRRAAAEAAQDMVDEQRLAPHGTELALDEFVEFSQPHTVKPSGSDERRLEEQ